MIQVISRFRVKNGLEARVRDAFFDRPHLVDLVAGFLGMEVFTAAEDPAIFYLVTRWTDVDSFQHWHASDAHRLSHQGIPRGLKVDRSFTQVLTLERLHEHARPVDLAEIAADSALLLAGHLASTQFVHLIVAAADGTIRACNPAIAALLKRPVDELVGKCIWQFLPEADGAALRRRVESAVRGQKDRFLVNVVDADDVPLTLECLVDVQPDGFVLLGEAPKKQDAALQDEMVRLNNDLAVLTRENVRKSRELEKALAALKEAQARLVHHEKMASLGQLTAGIAHEINNPIAFVRNNQTTLRGDFEDLLALVNVVGESLSEIAVGCPAVAEQIARKAGEIDLSHLATSVPQKIADNVDGLERVRRIVLDLRNFSRLDECEVKPCDIADGIRSGLRFLSTVLAEQGVTVRTQFPPLPSLLCAPGPLNQAISNVVVNAAQASPPGGIVNVSTAHENGFYLITVADKGSGISAQDLPKVFDPFFTTKPVGSGTGLGLSIAHQVIEAHHGDIQITSQVGQGTTVRLRVPLEPVAAAAPSGTSPAETTP